MEQIGHELTSESDRIDKVRRVFESMTKQAMPPKLVNRVRAEGWWHNLVAFDELILIVGADLAIKANAEGELVMDEWLERTQWFWKVFTNDTDDAERAKLGFDVANPFGPGRYEDTPHAPKSAPELRRVTCPSCGRPIHEVTGLCGCS